MGRSENGNGWQSPHLLPETQTWSDSSGNIEGTTHRLPSVLCPARRRPEAPDACTQPPSNTPALETGCTPLHLSRVDSRPPHLPHPPRPLREAAPRCSRLLRHTPGSCPSLCLTRHIYSLGQARQVHFLNMSVHLATSTATTCKSLSSPTLHRCGPSLVSPLPPTFHPPTTAKAP